MELVLYTVQKRTPTRLVRKQYIRAVRTECSMKFAWILESAVFSLLPPSAGMRTTIMKNLAPEKSVDAGQHFRKANNTTIVSIRVTERLARI